MRPAIIHMILSCAQRSVKAGVCQVLPNVLCLWMARCGEVHPMCSHGLDHRLEADRISTAKNRGSKNGGERVLPVLPRSFTVQLQLHCDLGSRQHQNAKLHPSNAQHQSTVPCGFPVKSLSDSSPKGSERAS